jgi:hypothetical protein
MTVNTKLIVNKVKELINNNYLFDKLEYFVEPNSFFTMHPKEIPMFEMMKKDPIDDLSIEYKYNNNGFRSDDFKTEHNKRHLLFSGCSEGEGIAADIDTVWNKIIYNSLNINNEYSGFFNVSIDNFGFHKIIFNVINYISKYGKPDELIILFPEVARVNEWNINNDSYMQNWANSSKLDSEHDQKIFMDALINFIPFMKLFESYCDTNNIKLTWSTWSMTEGQVYSMLNTFKHFFEIDYTLTDGLDQSKQVRRDGHQGEFYHRLWAQNFINRIKYEKHN